MDHAYLQTHVGEALAGGLAAVAIAQPADPIEYLGNWLLKQLDNQRRAELVAKELVEVEEQRAVREKKAKQEEEVVAEKETLRQKVVETIPECTDYQTLFTRTIAAIRENTCAKAVYISTFERDPLAPALPPDPAYEPDPVEPEPTEPVEGEEGAEGEAAAGEDAPPADENADGAEGGGEGDDGEGAEAEPEAPKERPLPRIPEDAFLKYRYTDETTSFLTGQRLMRGQGITFMAVDSRASVFVPNVIENVPPVHFFDMPLPGSAFSTCLKDRLKGILGVITVDTLGQNTHLKEEDCKFIEQIAEVAGLCQEKIKDELQRIYDEEQVFVGELETQLGEPEEDVINDEEDTAELIEGKMESGIERLNKVNEAIKEKVTAEKMDELRRGLQRNELPYSECTIKGMAAVLYMVSWTRASPIDAAEAEKDWSLIRERLGEGTSFVEAITSYDIKSKRVKVAYAAAKVNLAALEAAVESGSEEGPIEAGLRKEATKESFPVGLFLLWAKVAMEVSDKDVKRRVAAAKELEDPTLVETIEDDPEEDAEVQAKLDALEAQRKAEEEEAAAAAAAAAAEEAALAAAEAGEEGGEAAAAE